VFDGLDDLKRQTPLEAAVGVVALLFGEPDDVVITVRDESLVRVSAERFLGLRHQGKPPM
jgi:hypothetical protein